MSEAQKHFRIAFAVIYGFLVMFAFVIEEKKSVEEPCGEENNCQRFCCVNSTLCRENTIRESLDKSKFSDSEAKDLKILFGKPTCSLRPIKDTEKWHLISVRFP